MATSDSRRSTVDSRQTKGDCDSRHCRVKSQKMAQSHCQLLPLVRQMPWLMSSQINVHITYALSEALSFSLTQSDLTLGVSLLGSFSLGLSIKIAAFCLKTSCILKFYVVRPKTHMACAMKCAHCKTFMMI